MVDKLAYIPSVMPLLRRWLFFVIYLEGLKNHGNSRQHSHVALYDFPHCGIYISFDSAQDFAGIVLQLLGWRL